MSGVTLAGGGPSSASASERALKLQTDGPHLVSMGGDRLSTSVTLHPLPQGRVTLGSGSGVDIPVKGTGVAPLHCHIENSEGVVTIYPLSENLSIDGVKVSGPTRLSQGVMLTIGRSNYMRFNHPAEAKLMKSVLPNPRISMAPINFEPADVVTYQVGKMNRKPPTAPRKSPRGSLSDSGSEDPPSSIMTKVSKFEYLAAQNLKKSFSPKVFSSNVPTVNIPVKDVLGKDISNSLTKNLPQSALNYAELNFNEKQQNKSANSHPILIRKHQPQYVNVAINDVQKSINNKVVIFENGCIPKTPPNNVNFDHNDLSNKTATKNVNVSRATSSSPSFNRRPSEGYNYYRSATPSPVSNAMKVEHRRSGSLVELTDHLTEDLRDLTCRKHEAEIKRTQAQRDRIKEQELEKAEQQRLEEILNMCAEYEKQTSPVEKSKPVTPNRIITNGSLPRDKRHLGPPSPSYCSPPQSPLDILHNELLKQSSHHYENVSLNHHQQPSRAQQYENVDLRHQEKNIQSRHENGISSYENVVSTGNSQGSYPPSPRTRIKTFITPNKSPKDSQESLENKYAVLETEKKLLREAEIVLRQNLHNFKEVNVLPQNYEFLDLEPRKSTPTKFIFALEDESCSNPTSENRQSTESRLEDDSSNMTNNSSSSSKEYNLDASEKENEEQKKRMEQLKKEKKDILAVISRIKRQMAEVEIQEEELHREIELEKALINGEYKSKQLEVEKIETKKQKLLKRAQRIEESMVDCQLKQEEDQKKCKEKLAEAQEHMTDVEEKLKNSSKGSSEYEQVFEDYLQAQEQLDNERKTFEDLEFHHLEEEADWLASREELQREIVELSNKIDHLRNHIQELENQKHNTSKTNSKEYRNIERHKMECMVRLEEIRSRLKHIDNELSSCSNPEYSDREYSSDSSDSDKSKDIDRQLSNKMTDLSVSMIVSNSHKVAEENEYNMSQSYNEKLFEEKSVLEGATKRFPSQDDIDRISKVTSDTPIIEERESLGRKTIESLKDIDRRRHLHLCQQGSQVIEQERQRMNAIKQKVQEEVKSQWAQQQRQESPSLDLTEANRCSNGDSSSNDKIDTPSPSQEEDDSLREENNENSRPMSEISEMSLEVGTLNRKRNKTPSDKQRPLTRYLPIRGSDLDLRQHIESAGHQVVLCPHVIINSNSCRGFLHKRGSKLNGWSRRWFVFDRLKHTLTYYSDKSEKKPRGGAYFQAIEEVYLDHLNNIKSPNPHLTFIVKTHERHYYLMAPSPEAMRIWVDVIFTGAEGYREFEHGT